MGKVFIINGDGSKREVLNIQELQELARQGAVLPETKIEAKGRVVNAGKIKELTGVFIATRIQRQNAEKAGGAAVNDAPEVNGASPDAFKALEDFGSVPPADTALPPVADSAVEGALYAGEMEIPEEFKPKPEAVKKAKQKQDDAFEAFWAKYPFLVIDEQEIEDVVKAKYKTAIWYADRAISGISFIKWFFGILTALLTIPTAFFWVRLFMLSGEVIEAVLLPVGVESSIYFFLLLTTLLTMAVEQALRFAKNCFIAYCKESLIREIYLSKLIQKDGE